MPTPKTDEKLRKKIEKRLQGRGMTPQQIADEYGISLPTAYRYLRLIAESASVVRVMTRPPVYRILL